LKKKTQYSKGPRASAIPTSLPKGKYVIFFDAKAQTISILEKSKTTLVEKGLKMADILYPHKQAHLYQSLDLPELCC
jgi:hypothetical protein